MTLEYVDYIMWDPQISWNICLLFIHLEGHLEIWVELYSWHYSRELLLIPIFFTENIIHSKNIVENTDNVRNIHTIHVAKIHYLYRCGFLPIF